MKLIKYENGKKVIYCQKKDIMFLYNLNNLLFISLLGRINECDDEKYIKLTEEKEVDFIANQDTILDLEEIIKLYKSHKLQGYIDELSQKLSLLGIKRFTTIKNKTKKIELVQQIDSILYQIESINSYIKNPNIVPFLSNDFSFKSDDDKYTMYGTYNDKVLFIKKNNEEHFKDNDKISGQFLSDGLQSYINQYFKESDNEMIKYQYQMHYLPKENIYLIKIISLTKNNIMQNKRKY